VSLNQKVAILGAGMSAIACADHLSKSFDIEIYEKSKGVGGRLCSRNYQGDARFHFGAQFCTITQASFHDFLKRNHAENFYGSAIDLNNNKLLKTDDYYIHPNGMQSLLKETSASMNINFESKVTNVDAKTKNFTLNNHLIIPYDILISSLPFPQSQELINFPATIRTEFSPCIAVGLLVNSSSQNKYNAFKNINNEVSWVGSSKFYNPSLKETWVIQLSPIASEAKKEESDEALITYSHKILDELLGGGIELNDSSVFRWKFAQCDRSTHDQYFTSLSDDIYAIGDWHLSPRVESAFLSGKALAEHLNSKNI